MPREGENFGPYKLVKQIAVGGMAEIYLAKSEGFSGFEKHVALKMIHPNFSSDSHFVRMLVEEAKITVFLNHVNIGQIFDLGRIGDIYYIAMEFIDGPDIYRIMRRLTEQGHQMPCDVAAYIIHEANAGLDYAHRCRDQLGNPLNIIHRDISPQNIMISRSGEVKIVDFGIAKAALRARQTAVGVIKGKYYYMSPEQAWGEPLDARTDIFSTGVVLYEILAGQMLHLEEDVAILLDLVRRANIPPLRKKRPDVPPELEAVVMKAVAKDPNDRWQSANEFQHALHTFLYRYSPGFNVQKLQSVVHLAMTGSELVNAPHGGPGGAKIDSRMDRDVFTSMTKHSVIFSDNSIDSLTQPPPGFAFSVDESFDENEETVISGPPSFTESVGGDPALPFIAKSLSSHPLNASHPSLDIPAPPPSHGRGISDWDDQEENEPTAVLPNARVKVSESFTEDPPTVPRNTTNTPQREHNQPDQWEAKTANFRGRLHNTPSSNRVGPQSVPPHPSSFGHQAGPPQMVQDEWGHTEPDYGQNAHHPNTPGLQQQYIPQGWQGYHPGVSSDPAGFGTDFEDPLYEEQFELIQARSKNRRLALLVLGLFVLIGGLAAIFFIFLPSGDRPTSGDVRVITEPPGAHIECDGEPQRGLTPDVTIRNLSAEKNHSLYITKPGYVPLHKSFSVTPGKIKTIRVELEPK